MIQVRSHSQWRITLGAYGTAPLSGQRFERLRSLGLLLALYAVTLAVMAPLLSSLDRWLAFAIATPLIWLSASDLKTGRIPDAATTAVTMIALIRVVCGPIPTARMAFATAACVGAALWLTSEVYFRRRGHEALGLGDVKLITALALLLGPIGLWSTLLLASLGGIASITAGRILRSDKETRSVPFGPFLAYGGFVSLTVVSAGG